MSLKTVFVTAASLAAQVHAANYKVTANTDLTFSPNEVTAAVGDTVEFFFTPKNHSVVAGTFDSPCQPATSGGFFSGYMPVSSGVGVGIRGPPGQDAAE